ncbi:MAG: hypothetical protein LAO77_09065 [Acidobacteriia bacterium]|nr:hypothetical protein [Terriglobia bacterium]
MMSSLDDAFLLLNKWKTEQASLKVMFVCNEAGFWTVGTLHEVSETPPAFEVHGPSANGFCLVDLAGASVTYEDPAEAPSPVRDFSRARYVDSLQFTLASGDRCVIFQLRENE